MDRAAERIIKGPTKAQIKTIHTLASALGYDECAYRVVLYRNYKVMSSKSLTTGEAAELIDALLEQAIKDGVWTRKTAFEHLGNRPGMATPAQLRAIETMWHRVTGINDEESRKKALRAFLFNRFHLSDMRFVGKEHVTGILTALRSMKARKNGNGVTPLRPRPGGGEAYRCG